MADYRRDGLTWHSPWLAYTVMIGLMFIGIALLSGCGTSSFTDSADGPGYDIDFSTGSTASIEQNVAYGAGPLKKLDIYTPSRPSPGKPVLIFFHGGFWQSGDKKDYAFLGQTMAQRGILTIIVNYTLYPQASYPEFLKDGANAVAWIRENVVAYGGNPRHIFLMGDSAGAYIATMLASDPEYLTQVGLSQNSIAGVIGISGLYNFLPFNGQNYASVFQDAPSLDNTQPIHFASANAPPMLLIASRKDNIVDPQNTTSYVARIKQVGGRVDQLVYDNTGHVGLLLSFSPNYNGSKKVPDQIASFILKQADTPSAKTN